VLGYFFAALGLLMLAGYLATFMPGAAALHYAWRRRSLLLGLLGLLLLATPLLIPGLSEGRWGRGVANAKTDLAYALCFFPGLLVLLHKVRSDIPSPPLWVPMSYLAGLIVLATGTSVVVDAYVGTVAFAILGIFVLVGADNLKSIFAARILGSLLLLAPVGATLVSALPRHLELNREMQAACASDPGLLVTAAPAPVWSIAMDMESIYDGSGHVCARLHSSPRFERYTPQHQCFAPVHEGWLTGIEVGSDGWHPHRLPPGLYLYQVRTPNEVETFGLSPLQEEQACAARTRSEGVEHCIGFGPVSALTADYLLRRRGSVPKFDAVYSESFEIIERSGGETMARTTGFYAEKGNRDSLLAAPLQHLLPRERACAENGPPLLPFLQAFVEASRGGPIQSSSR
jgi:hypothetical protein